MADAEEPTKEFVARKEFLLHQARRARMKFILQARDPADLDAHQPKAKEEKADDAEKAGATTATAAKLAQQQRSKVPAAECVQQVLDFFHFLLPDEAEAVDVDQLLLSVQDTDVDDDLRSFEATAGAGALSDYDRFLRKLLLPQAAHIVKMLQQFVLKTQTRYRNLQLLPTTAFGTGAKAAAAAGDKGAASGPLRPEEVWDFIDGVCQSMQETELWAAGPTSTAAPVAQLAAKAAAPPLPLPTAPSSSSSSSSAAGGGAAAATLLPLDPAVEVFVERLVFRKVGDFLFAGDRDEARRNHLTAQRLSALQFVTAEHLDIRSLQGLAPAEISALLAGPCEALLQLNRRASPSDKVACLRSCCAQIAQLLKRLKLQRDAAASAAAGAPHHHSANAMTALPGADELLPLMIYVALKTPVAELHSQVRFLQTLTRPRLMLSEAGYLVTQFVSAVYFLDNVDARALMIEPDAFDAAMLQAKQRAKSDLQRAQQAQQALILAQSARARRGGGGGAAAAGDAAGASDALDVQRIVAQYRAEAKQLDQRFAAAAAGAGAADASDAAGAAAVGAVGATAGAGAAPSWAPLSLREYRAQYRGAAR